MRITQNMSYRLAVAAMHNATRDIADVQQQLSTSQKFQTAAQDPVDAAHLLNLNAQLAGISANGKALDVAQLKLQTEAQALSDAQDIFQQASTLAVQANAGTLDATARTAIAQQITSLKQQLVDIANRSNADGQPLFGGGVTSGAVFETDASGAVQYSGGDQPNWLQVDTAAAMPTGDTGRQVFMSSPSGTNGLQVRAGAGNRGNLVVGSVTPSASNPAPAFTISFGSGTWTAKASDNSVLASGSYSSGQSLNVQGVTVALSGQPSAGDTLSVQPAVDQSLFSTLEALANAVKLDDSTQRSNAVNAAASAVHAGLKHLTLLETRNGGRLNALTALQSAQKTQNTNVQAVASRVGGTDYAEAASRLTLLTTTLQAAQQSFARIQSLSLFQWLR